MQDLNIFKAMAEMEVINQTNFLLSPYEINFAFAVKGIPLSKVFRICRDLLGSDYNEILFSYEQSDYGNILWTAVNNLKPSHRNLELLIFRPYTTARKILSAHRNLNTVLTQVCRVSGKLARPKVIAVRAYLYDSKRATFGLRIILPSAWASSNISISLLINLVRLAFHYKYKEQISIKDLLNEIIEAEYDLFEPDKFHIFTLRKVIANMHRFVVPRGHEAKKEMIHKLQNFTCGLASLLSYCTDSRHNAFHYRNSYFEFIRQRCKI